VSLVFAVSVGLGTLNVGTTPHLPDGPVPFGVFVRRHATHVPTVPVHDGSLGTGGRLVYGIIPAVAIVFLVLLTVAFG